MSIRSEVAQWSEAKRRYYYDAEYHALVHLVGHLCWWVGCFREAVK